MTGCVGAGSSPLAASGCRSGRRPSPLSPLIPALNVLLGQFWDALQGKRGERCRQALEFGDIASPQGGIPLRHQLAACGVHVGIILNRLGSVKWGK